MKLLRHPVDDLAKLLRHGACVRASHPRKHLTVAVALDELHWDVEVQQTRDRFTRHRALNHIAPDHDMVYVCVTNLLEYGLEGGEVRMNIVECSDAHLGFSTQSLSHPRLRAIQRS